MSRKQLKENASLRALWEKVQAECGDDPRVKELIYEKASHWSLMSAVQADIVSPDLAAKIEIGLERLY